MTAQPFLFAILLLFQGDDQGIPVPPPHSSSNAILEMLRASGPIALTVLGLLAIASLFSWAIILGKWDRLSPRPQSKPGLPSRLSQGGAIAGDWRGLGTIQAKSAGERLRRSL